MKKVTYESIGNRLGISKVSVYKALNNKGGVSKELREKIKQTALSLGYQPTISTYHENCTFLFAVRKEYFLKISEQFYTEIYYYLVEECKNYSSKVEILLTEEDNEFQSIQQFLVQNNTPVHGVFIAGPISNSSLAQFDKLTVPTVFIDFYSPLYNYNYVYLDNYNLAYLATDILIQKGHKEIGFIGDIHSTTSICDRYLGYRKALIQNNLSFNPDYHINKSIESSRGELDPTILPKKLPTAYICHCDSCAEILYLLLKIRGLRIPDDVSVLSFDNTDLCKQLYPHLSSIGKSKDKYAKKSLDLMLDLLNNSKNSTVLLTPHMHLRESVKDISQSSEQ